MFLADRRQAAAKFPSPSTRRAGGSLPGGGGDEAFAAVGTVALVDGPVRGRA